MPDERYDRDPEKSIANLAKHGVSFDEAITVFGDPLATTVFDSEHSIGEERWLTMGLSSRQRIVIVSHTNRGESVRLIGARPATPQERRVYELGE